MRKPLFYLVLLLVGCGGNGIDFSGTGLPAVRHAPEISGLALSPSSVMYVEGGGNVAVVAQVEFRDTGLDIQTLYVRLPDDTIIEFSESADTATGALAEQITMSTETVGAFSVEFWLVDKAGDTSNHMSATLNVVGTRQSDNWTSRLTGLPFVLNDVHWTGEAFIAVGDSGAILTSADGIEWVERASYTDADLVAVDSQGPDVVAVGSETTVLLSSDNGAGWTIKHSGDRVRLKGVAVTDSQIVVGGMNQITGNAFIMRSMNRGESWVLVESLSQSEHFVNDLVFWNGLFVAAAGAWGWESDARVLVSLDGNDWHGIVVREEDADLFGILHDGNQFIATSGDGTVFVSPNGYNWTELATPVREVTYENGAWNGSRLIVAGGLPDWYWWFLDGPDFERPVGISSTDGGLTWDIFNIDGYYQSGGMAWGAGRFVSVGQSTPVSGEGAIYTTD